MTFVLNNTCIQQSLQQSLVRTESVKKGTFYTGAHAFNNLPPHLKEVDSIVIFNTLLTGIIFEISCKYFGVFLES